MCGTSGDIIRSRELPPYADQRAALSSMTDELRQEGWNIPETEQQSHFSVRRGSDSLQISLSIVAPEFLKRASFL